MAGRCAMLGLLSALALCLRPAAAMRQKAALKAQYSAKRRDAAESVEQVKIASSDSISKDGDGARSQRLAERAESGDKKLNSTAQLIEGGGGSQSLDTARAATKPSRIIPDTAYEIEEQNMTYSGNFNYSDCRFGVGLSLDWMKRKLPVEMAARKIQEAGFRCVRLWHYQADYLQALLDVGIRDVLVNVPTAELRDLAGDWDKARAVVAILKPFHTQGMRFRVSVADEPLAPWHGGTAMGQYLVPALEKMHLVLQHQGLTDVTTTVCFHSDLLVVRYPAHLGEFKDDMKPIIRSVANFFHQNGGEFNVAVYPYFSVMQDSVPINDALGGHMFEGRYQYRGVMDQNITAMRAALVRLDPKFSSLPMSIGETGWPTKGSWAAQTYYAKIFTESVLGNSHFYDDHLRSIFFFEAFDQELKSGNFGGQPGSETEDHFGMMYENGRMKWNLNHAASASHLRTLLLAALFGLGTACFGLVDF